MLPALSLKICPRCDRVKVIGEFYVSPTRGDGLSGYCRGCDRAWNRQRTLDAKLRAIAALGGVCPHCGIDDHRCLQIDHVDGRQGAKREGGIGYFSRVAANPDPTKYQLLCANANSIKKFEQEEMVGDQVYDSKIPTSADFHPTTREMRWDEERKGSYGKKMSSWFANNPEAAAERNRKIRETKQARTPEQIAAATAKRKATREANPEVEAERKRKAAEAMRSRTPEQWAETVAKRKATRLQNLAETGENPTPE